MSVRHPMLCTLAVAVVATCRQHSGIQPAEQEQLFMVSLPALRAWSAEVGTSAGAQVQVVLLGLQMQAVPEPRQNDAILLVELERSSLHLGGTCASWCHSLLSIFVRA